MGNWLEAWIDARKAGGQTSTRENRSHYVTHIAPAIGAKHLRDWTADDLRRLSRHLDLQIENGTIAWKTARNGRTSTSNTARSTYTARAIASQAKTSPPRANRPVGSRSNLRYFRCFARCTRRRSKREVDPPITLSS